MKRMIMTALLLLTVLGGCGAKQPQQVDLQAFFEKTQEKYDLAGMVELEEEMLDAFYPGLSALNTVQCVAYAPMISASVSEYVFLQCADRDSVQKAEEIFRQRIAEQAEGGAWYPESMAAWSRAVVVTRDDYVLLIASADDAERIAADFAAIFP